MRFAYQPFYPCQEVSSGKLKNVHRPNIIRDRIIQKSFTCSFSVLMRFELIILSLLYKLFAVILIFFFFFFSLKIFDIVFIVITSNSGISIRYIIQLFIKFYRWLNVKIVIVNTCCITIDLDSRIYIYIYTESFVLYFQLQKYNLT